MLTVLAELGQVNIRRAYGNWAKPALANWNKITHRFGLQPMQQFDLTKGKNATDMAMTIDAIDLLYDGKVDGFGIMSSDSDFTPLVTRLRQDGLIVYGFGSAKAPEAFKTACTRYIDVDQLITTLRQGRRQGRRRSGSMRRLSICWATHGRPQAATRKATPSCRKSANRRQPVELRRAQPRLQAPVGPGPARRATTSSSSAAMANFTSSACARNRFYPAQLPHCTVPAVA